MLCWNKETANPWGHPITWKTTWKSGKTFSLLFPFLIPKGSNFWSLVGPKCRTWTCKLREMKVVKKKGERKDSFITARLPAMFRFGRNSSKTVDFGWLSSLTIPLGSQEHRSAGANEDWEPGCLPAAGWWTGNADLRKRSTCFTGNL